MNYAHTYASQLVNTQPIHDPKQVTSLGQLKIGTKFRRYGKGTDPAVVFIVTRINTEGSAPEVFFKAKKGVKTLSFFTSDYAVTPYKDGKWNAHNYIVLA